MKNKVSSPKILNVILCVVILLIFVLILGTRARAETLTIENASQEIPLSKQVGYDYKNLSLVSYIIDENEFLEEKVLDIDYYIDMKKDTLEFFCKLFDYRYDEIVANLQKRNENNENIEITNIGYLKDKDNNIKTYSSFEYGLIEYFYYLNDIKEVKRNVKYIPYTGSAAYVEDLIRFFASIYSNVDVNTLLSIGASESGYYKVKFMLKYNNVYGGMSSKGLIKHNNIEQGVLSFVRLMSKNYYGKGFISIESIGKIYCPVYENGVKKASSHWINLVYNAKKKYEKYDKTITINDLLNIEEI